MRIDYEARTILCSVGDLVCESTYRRFGVERGDGFRRMWLGQEIHSKRAEERAGADPHYRPEVCVTHSMELRGWTITISGRIDGLSVNHQARLAIPEEVKSLHFDLELEALYRSEKLHRHLFQLMLYAFFLGEQPSYAGFRISPQLVLVDLITGATQTVDAPFDRDDVASALEASVGALLDRVEGDEALRVAKKAFARALVFPFATMRPFQKEMVESVARAVREKETLLVSAPTGIGKTMAALYPALRESLLAGKKLFYLTSKTLQQEIAVSALRMLNDGSLRVLRIRSKQKMCANDEIICHEDFCRWAARYSEKMDKSGLRSTIVTGMSYFDPDITFEMSKTTEVCPFEVSLELIEEADVVICDYNYIFDPYVGLKTYQQDDDYGDCVLIIDEAHNLVDRGRGYYSPELHEKTFEQVRAQLVSRDCGLEGWEELLGELKSHFQELAEAIETESDARQALCEPSRRLFVDQRAEWERLVLDYITWKIANRIAEANDPLIDFYFKLVKFTNLLSDDGEELSKIIEQTPEGLKLKIFCKDPSRFLGPILDSAHAAIAISATLEPFDFYRKTLGFPTSRTAELSLPSPFPRENRKIVIVPAVDTTWKQRALHYDGISKTVAEMADASEGNFLALFPSYAFLREVSERLPILRKNVMTQRSDMTDYERSAILDVLRDTKKREGNLILAVSGGMYAEGIDYQGDMLSGVFVVGPALPPVTFEQELLKAYFDEQYGAGFEYAYLIPGMMRVVQSAGRVIRSESDIGVIALLCKRFTHESYTRYFPADWYEESPRELVTKKPAEEIRSFFEARRSPQLTLLRS